MKNLLSALLCVIALLPGAAFAAADQQAEILADRYRAAHQSGDLRRLEELVHWQAASERTREIIGARLAKHLELAIDEIEFRPLAGDEQFSPNGYRPNLLPVGYLAITFVSPVEEESRYRGIVFVIGEREGRYWITVAARERRS